MEQGNSGWAAATFEVEMWDLEKRVEVCGVKRSKDVRSRQSAVSDPGQKIQQGGGEKLG